MIKSDGRNHLFFDPQCPLCQRFVKGLEYFCKFSHYEFHNIHEMDKGPFSQLEKEIFHHDIYLLTSERQWLKGAAAVQLMAAECSQVDKLSWLLSEAIRNKAIDAFYQSASRLRKTKYMKICKKCP